MSNLNGKILYTQRRDAVRVFLLNFYMMTRKLYLSYRLLLEAIQDKERLDALSFAMMIKANFSNSRCYKRSVREMKVLFGMGTDKYRRVLKNAIKFGYVIVSEDNSLCVRDIKHHKHRNVVIKVRKNSTKSLSESITGAVKCANKIKDIESALLRKAICCHLEKVAYIENVKKVLSTRNDAFFTLDKKEFSKLKRKGTKIVDSMSGLDLYEMTSGKNYYDEGHYVREGISKTAISRVIKRSKGTVNKIIRGLSTDGLITVSPRYYDTAISRVGSRGLDREYAKDMFGYLRTFKDKSNLVLQGCNVYTVNEKNFVKI